MAFLFQFSKENACPLQPDTHKSLIYIDSARRTLARPQEKTRYISAFTGLFLDKKMGNFGAKRSRGHARKWLSPFGNSKKSRPENGRDFG